MMLMRHPTARKVVFSICVYSGLFVVNLTKFKRNSSNIQIQRYRKEREVILRMRIIVRENFFHILYIYNIHI